MASRCTGWPTPGAVSLWPRPWCASPSWRSRWPVCCFWHQARRVGAQSRALAEGGSDLESAGPRLARRRGFLAARTLKIGADDEPLRYLQETIPWVKCGPWQDPHDGFAYDEAAARVNWPPLWMISAKADKVLGHPTDVRRFSDEMGSATRHTRLGRDNGNRLDYDHINMLTAPQAQEDHFPQILDWLLNPQAA